MILFKNDISAEGLQQMNKDFFKITGLYIAAVALAFGLIWGLLGVALPEANLNLVRALSTAFGINLPEDMVAGGSAGLKAFSVIFVIALLSLALIVLNVFFGAVVTARFIHPRIDLITSAKGALSTTWNSGKPYVLVRMANFHKADLADVRLSVVLTVEETRDNGEEFLCYLPVSDFTPPRVLVLAQKTPWSIAVPADAHLGNSITKDYHFAPGTPIEKSFAPGKTAVAIRRTLEILIQGVDTRSHAPFVIHRKIAVDEQARDKYILHLHRGAFKSLPLRIEDAGALELYADTQA
jgi:hypothetical protein